MVARHLSRVPYKGQGVNMPDHAPHPEIELKTPDGTRPLLPYLFECVILSPSSNWFKVILSPTSHYSNSCGHITVAMPSVLLAMALHNVQIVRAPFLGYPPEHGNYGKTNICKYTMPVIAFSWSHQTRARLNGLLIFFCIFPCSWSEFLASLLLQNIKWTFPTTTTCCVALLAV